MLLPLVWRAYCERRATPDARLAVSRLLAKPEIYSILSQWLHGAIARSGASFVVSI